MFPYKPNSEMNDFYDSIQAIQDPYENNEDFGKFVPEFSHSTNFLKKTYSYTHLNGISYAKESAKKSFSSNSFHDNDYELQNYYGASPYSYKLEDHSTMASLESINSFNSPSSLQSVTKSGTQLKTCKVKHNKSGGKKRNNDQDYKKKYKTEFCKYWQEKGFCEFGDQCAFAHGTQEVRQKQHISSNYKTKKCTQFHENGYCPYGVRCQFIHSFKKDCQIKPCLEQVSYTEALENAELWINSDADCLCMQAKARPRLPSFQQITTNDVC